MAYFFEDEIVGTRTRFQRLADASPLYGWVESFEKDVLVVSTPLEMASQVNDRFVFQGHTKNATVRFLADLVSTGGRKEGQEGPLTEILHVFRIIGRMECLPPSEETRHRIAERPVSIIREGQSYEGSLCDVSATGAAILSDTKFEVGNRITLQLEEKQRSLSVEAEVKYSFPSKDGNDKYRTGLKLVDCNRLVGAQWRGLLDAA